MKKKKQVIQPHNFSGLEIIGELRGCAIDHLTRVTIEQLHTAISLYIKKQGFQELGSYFYQFDIGCTGVIALGESHIAFHTWPNQAYVSLNVYVCNYQQNNTEKTKELFSEIAALFLPEKIETTAIERQI